jgi:phage protein D
MSQAAFSVNVGGTNITGNVGDILISIAVNLYVGTHGDTATIVIDDSYGRVLLPGGNAACVISLGWKEGGIREVFSGNIDKVMSIGGRGGGRTLRITAHSFNTAGPAKQPQQRHFDNKPIKSILEEAGKVAGIMGVKIDPGLGSIVRPYVAMADESFLHLGERLAREIGGNFKVSGGQAQITARTGTLAGSVTAAWGDNLHTWEIVPKAGRPAFGAAIARYYDRLKGTTVDVKRRAVPNANAVYAHRWLKAHHPADPGMTAAQKAGTDGSFTPLQREQNAAADAAGAAGGDAAARVAAADAAGGGAATAGGAGGGDPATTEPDMQAESDASTSIHDEGTGTVTIEGNVDAVPDGTCVVTGTRDGVDGSYRIDGVTHTLDRASGFKTSMLLKQPGGGAGTDSRALDFADAATAGNLIPTDAGSNFPG